MSNEYTKEYAPEEIVQEVQLSMVEGIGSLSCQRLIERFGSVEAIFNASCSELEQVERIGPKISRAIHNARDCREAENTIQRCRNEGILLIPFADRRYPERLRMIHDPPLLLYVKGQIEPADVFAIAVVGTRGISYYGKRATIRLVSGLVAAGFTIVSGLARGVDGVAHDAALGAGGRTLAVLGSGLQNIYPPEHQTLAARVATQGAVMSEFPLDAAGYKGNFPRRNRIVSGLSLGVLVTESPLRSGSLITARLAMEQDRDVFAVPGPIDTENYRGCHRLIRDGAVLVETADDIIEVLQPLTTPIQHPKHETKVHIPREVNLDERESKLLGLIDVTPISVDTLIDISGLAAHQVLVILSVLEMRGIIVRVGGNTVRRV